MQTGSCKVEQIVLMVVSSKCFGGYMSILGFGTAAALEHPPGQVCISHTKAESCARSDGLECLTARHGGGRRGAAEQG